MNCLTAGRGLLDDAVVLDVVGIVGLDVNSEAVERALEGILGGRVHHAGLCDSCQYDVDFAGTIFPFVSSIALTY